MHALMGSYSILFVLLSSDRAPILMAARCVTCGRVGVQAEPASYSICASEF